MLTEKDIERARRMIQTFKTGWRSNRKQRMNRRRSSILATRRRAWR